MSWVSNNFKKVVTVISPALGGVLSLQEAQTAAAYDNAIAEQEFLFNQEALAQQSANANPISREIIALVLIGIVLLIYFYKR